MSEVPNNECNGGTVSRRALIAGATAGGLAALLPAGAAAAGSGSSAGSSPPANAPGANPGTGPKGSSINFFSDSGLNFQTLFAIAAAAYGASELGEVLTAVDQIHARGSSYRAFYEVFLALGRRVRARGDAAARAGHRVTARDCYLRAAMYLDQAEFFVLASSTPTRAQEARVYREMEGSFAAAAARFRPAFQRVEIPYQRGRPLPGWLLTPPGPPIRRPTIILTNGSDGQNVDLFIYGGAAALERGWNALIFEGPGQGSMLFLHNLPFRPDWEKVITPIVNWLRRRPDVDRRRISLAGVSFGGYLAPRAAAFEHRLAAVVADPGVTDAFVSWSGSLPSNMLGWLKHHQRAQFDHYWREALPFLSGEEKFQIAKRAEIYGNRSFYDQMQLARKFVLNPAITGRVKAPAIITAPQGENFFPGQSRILNRWIRSRPHALAPFYATEGAQFHCEPMAPTVRNDTVFDWLESNLRPVG